ncbi:MAG: transcriptional repressor [Nanoarchaeota archaeon]|nr:transcriptional repressor [DPANN group archaeon]MBL7116201.1 transcriptional repressor [Nanoarchaeota archaeon]
MITTRNTEQRKKILEHLKNAHTHPTAEIVFKEVVKQLPKITLATVYRNLNLLAEQGKILRLEVNKEYHYDACIESHQHCVCEKCGRIIDSFKKNISKYALKKFQLKDFEPKSVTIIFRGTCKKCAEAN